MCVSHLKTKMELILPIYLLANIFSFLRKNDLIQYDTALTNKEKRSIYLETLQVCANNIQMTCCKWTNLKNIKRSIETVHYRNLRYISSNCKHLTVFTSYNQCEKYYQYMTHIHNDNIQYLHIDFGAKKCKLKIPTIKGKNLKQLRLVMYQDEIPDTYTKNIFSNCPELESIYFIQCGSDRLFSKKINKM